MEILGKKDESTYIVEIGVEEIAKVFNNYSIRDTPAHPLIVGKSIDLGNGFNFRNDIQEACRRMTETIEKFKSAQDTMMAFAKMVIDQEKEEGK